MPIEAAASTNALLAPTHIESRSDAVLVCARIEDTMEALLQLIEAESVLLRAGKTIAASALESRKSDFAQSYLDDLRLLRIIGSELEYWAPEAVDRLRRLHEEFVSVLQIDMAALVTARAISETRDLPPAASRKDLGSKGVGAKGLGAGPGRAPAVSIEPPHRRIPQRLAASRR